MRKAACLPVALALLLAVPAPGLEPVSPGPGDLVAARCPAFSWSGPLPTPTVLVVHRVPSGKEVLRQLVPAGATAWTLALRTARCLERGADYVWSIGDSSPPAAFRVAAEPSPEEVREAIGVVQSFMGGLLGSDPDNTEMRAEQGDATGVTYGAYGISASSSAGSAGAVGEAPASGGDDVHGVLGIVASPTGVAGFFDNGDAGGDLLRGRNGSGTVFTVEDDGRVFATSFSGFGQSLTSVSTLSCSGCVDGSEVVDGEVGVGDLGTGAAGSDEIQTDAVGASELEPDGIMSADIAADAVRVQHVADGAIESIHVQNLSVTDTDIEVDSVDTDDFDDDVVTRAKLDEVLLNAYLQHADCDSPNTLTAMATCSCPAGTCNNTLVGLYLRRGGP